MWWLRGRRHYTSLAAVVFGIALRLAHVHVISSEFSYSYHRPPGGREDTVARRMASVKELWVGVRKLRETHPQLAWPVAHQATRLDPLDAASLFNAAVVREQHEEAVAAVGGSVEEDAENPGPTYIELFSKPIIWLKYDLRQQHESSIAHGTASYTQTSRSHALALDAWQDVLDVPAVPPNMKARRLQR